MYAILDIETTGGKYNEEGITEIAIYRFDGHQVVDQFSSLINPERPIQPFVANLTGINNEMLRQAPKFYEVAKRIIEITDGCITVAHNALFDNRILTTEFERLGYPFERESLCTVELSKKLIPDMPSYSLGKLVRSLGIPLSDRHRAQGDARATLALFKLLLARDTSKEIIKETLRKEPKKTIKAKHLEILATAPSETGVYYMHDAQGNIIYIGKSKNIKKRLTQHFTNDNRKSKRIQLEVNSVTFEKTGSELIAMLKEYEEIKRNRPVYNRSFQRNLFTHQLTTYLDNEGYIHLQIEKADRRKKAIITFGNYQKARQTLAKITEEYQLCPVLNGLAKVESAPCQSPATPCACNRDEPSSEYNKRVRAFLENCSYQNQNKLIIDRGREIEERSVIWLENGQYRGYGYYNLNYQITNRQILKSIVHPTPNSMDAQHIIHSYLGRKKVLKTVNLPSDNNK